MKEQDLKIIYNEKIAKDIYRMTLRCPDTSNITPGQFMNIAIEGKYLRRPISICGWDSKAITIVYKVIGEGTDWLSTLKKGHEINVLMPLGHGFNLFGQKLVVGGGIGCPPLFSVCKALNAQRIRPKIILGFKTKDEVILEDDFKNFGDVIIATDDGSYGTKGLVTDIIKSEGLEKLPYVACGPLPMEKALFATMESRGLISLETRMGCGFGACMGCSIETKEGPKRICKDGPVFGSEDLLW